MSHALPVRASRDPALRRFAIASLLFHVFFAWITNVQRHETRSSEDVTTVDVITEPPPVPTSIAVPEIPKDARHGATTVANEIGGGRERAAVPIPPEKTGESIAGVSNVDAVDAGAPPVSTEACEGDDCVLADLGRCMQGDGDGCVGVGMYYERGRGDAFSAIKWYKRGCGLESKRACTSLARVSGTDVPWISPEIKKQMNEPHAPLPTYVDGETPL